MHGIDVFTAEETAGAEPGVGYSNDSDLINSNGANKPLLEENVSLAEEVNELRSRLFKTEERLRNFEDANVDLRAQLAMEKSKRTLSKSERYDSEEWKQICEQIKYKDNRIVELNNVIMEKERRIIDLQEQCCSQGQAALSKKMAMQIVSRRLQELDGRVVKDVGTETDASMFRENEQRTAVLVGGRLSRPPSTNASLSAKSSARGRSFSPPISSSTTRNDSPGRAVPHHRPYATVAFSSSVSKGSSPPPVDPSEDITAGSWLSENAVGESGGGRLSPRQFRKFTTLTAGVGGGNSRKRVTFDLIANAETDGKAPLKSRLTDEQSKLLAENEQLRKTVTELERRLDSRVDAQLDSGEDAVAKEDDAVSIVVNRKNVSTNFANLEKTGKMQVIKARAVAQSRIRELEDNISNLQTKHSKDLELMHSANESLKTSRDWMLNENANLLKRNEEMRVKIDDLLGELDATMAANSSLRQRLDDADKKIDALGLELGDVRRSLHATADVKHILLSEVERLKASILEALVAQEKYASMLESDIVVYEAHVGILKDTLGSTTKTEDREIIKSKAFKAKLSALEVEKKEIAKRSNDDRLKIKALSVKVRCLEQERDELLRRLQHATSFGAILSSASLHDHQHRGSLPPLIHPQALSAVDHQQLHRKTSSTMALKGSGVGNGETSNEFPTAAALRLMASCSPFTPIGAGGTSLGHSTPSTPPTSANWEDPSATRVDVNSANANTSAGSTQAPVNFVTANRLIFEDSVTDNLMLPAATNFVKPMAVVASNAHEVVAADAAVPMLEQLQERAVEETGSLQHDECLAREALLKSDFEARMADLQERNGQLEAELQKIFTDNSDLHSQLLSGAREMQSLRNGLSQIVAENLDVPGEGNFTLVEQQLSALRQLIVDIRQRAKTLSDELQHVQRDAEMERQKLVDELTLSHASVKALEEQKEQIVEDKAKAEANKAELEAELEHLKSVELANRDQRLSEADARLAELDVRLRDIEAQLEADREHHNIMRDGKQRLEFQLEERDKRLLEIMVAKEHVDQRIVALQEDNAFLSATLVREKERLNRLVDLLRREVDRFRVEAEVSRNCLDDLRQNSSHNLLQRLPQPSLSAGNNGNRSVSRDDATVKRQEVEATHLELSTSLPSKLTCSDVYLSPTNKNEEISVETVDVEVHLCSKSTPEEAEAERRHQVNVQYANEFLAMNTVVNAENDGEERSVIRGEFRKSVIQKEELSSSVTNTSAAEKSEDARLLTECVAESESMEEHLTANINDLMELNAQLETSVDVLKAEIWSLNNQMCKLFDHEDVLEKLGKCEQCLAESNEQLSVKTRTVEELRSALSAKCNEMEQIYVERSRMEQELTEFAERCARLQEQVNDQGQRLTEFEKSNQYVNALESANDALRHRLSDDEALLKTLNRELELRAEQLLALETDRSLVLERSHRLAERLHELEQSYADLLAKVEVEKAEKCVDCSLDHLSEPNNSEAIDGEKSTSSQKQKKKRPCSTTTDHATTNQNDNNNSTNDNAKNRWLDPIHMKLAILAARFDAKSADNEALFRVNAELAHANSRLQTTIEELEAKVESLSSASTTSSQLSLRRSGAGGGRSEDEEGGSVQPLCRMRGSSGGDVSENPCRIAEEEAEAHHIVEDEQKSSFHQGGQVEEVPQLEAPEEVVKARGPSTKYECNNGIFGECRSSDMMVQEQSNGDESPRDDRFELSEEKSAEEPRVVIVDLSISALESSSTAKMTVHSVESNSGRLETVNASFSAAKLKKVKKAKKSKSHIAKPIQQLAESIGRNDLSVSEAESQVAGAKPDEHTSFSFNGGFVATRLFDAVGSAASAAKNVVSAAVKDITIREGDAVSNECSGLDVVLRWKADGLTASSTVGNKRSGEEDAKIGSGLDLLNEEEPITCEEMLLNNCSTDLPHRIVKRTKSNESVVKTSTTDFAVAKAEMNVDSWNDAAWKESDDDKARNDVASLTSKDCKNLTVAEDNEWAPNGFCVDEVRETLAEPADVAAPSMEWGDAWGDDVDAADDSAWKDDDDDVDCGSKHNEAENAENESWDW